MASDPRGHIDAIAVGERDDGLLLVGTAIFLALPALGLALLDHRVDREHLDAEQRFDGGLDLGLGRRVGDLEDDLR